MPIHNSEQSVSAAGGASLPRWRATEVPQHGGHSDAHDAGGDAPSTGGGDARWYEKVQGAPASSTASPSASPTSSNTPSVSSSASPSPSQSQPAVPPRRPGPDDVQAAANCWAREARWVKDPSVPRPYPETAQPWPCSGSKPDRNRPDLLYAWVPEPRCGAYRHDWDANSICKLMRGRNVLFVGDSITYTMAVSLYYTFAHVGAVSPPNVAGMNWRALCGGFGAPDFSFDFSRTDHLLLDDADRSRIPAGDNHDDAWLWGEHDKYTYAIINTGAHPMQPPDSVHMVRKALTRLKTDYPNVKVFYRNTPAGHVDCKNWTEPVDVPQDWSKLGEHKYLWHTFDGINHAVEQMIAAEFPNVLYFDVATMTSFRPDHHREPWQENPDCLHHCTPGVMDQWQELWANIVALMDGA